MVIRAVEPTEEIRSSARSLWETLLDVSPRLGVGVGLVAQRLMAALDDHLVEIMLSVVTAYGAYLLADRFGGSGIIAVVLGGLLIANFRTGHSMSESSRAVLGDVWEVLAFIANSVLSW